MVKRWHGWRNPWEREYAMRGALWRGVSPAGFLAAWVPLASRVLDLGCGDGKFLQGLSESGYRPVGLDFAGNALRLAQERLGVPLVRGDLRRLPFRAASVPAVAARYALGALLEDGRRAAAAEIERVLARHGCLMVEEFSPLDLRFGAGTPREDATFERNQGITTHYFEEDEVPRLFPTLQLRHHEAVVTGQRTDQGVRTRHRWRWILSR